MSTGTLEFETGITAFTGGQTWELTAAELRTRCWPELTTAMYLASADSDDDIATATLIGEYVVKRPGGGAIPEPTSLALIRSWLRWFCFPTTPSLVLVELK